MFPPVSFLFYDTEEEGRRGGSDARPGGANGKRGCVDKSQSIILPTVFSSSCTIMSLLKHGALRIRNDRHFPSLSLHFTSHQSIMTFSIYAPK